MRVLGGFVRRDVTHQVETGCRTPRLGRRGPARADTEIVDVGVGFGRGGLIDIVGRLTDEHILADDPTRRGRRKVILTHMQDVGPGERRDVGAVVDGEQGTARLSDLAQHGEDLQFLTRLECSEAVFARRSLVAQLHDVDAACERSVDELGQVAAFASGVGAEIEGRGLQSLGACVVGGHDRQRSHAPCRGSRGQGEAGIAVRWIRQTRESADRRAESAGRPR